jgi:elongation factor Ts
MTTLKITPEMVKNLRDRTGVPMGKCKEALEQSQGDMEKAIDFLRKSGMASAVKKEGRETKEGSIFFAETPNIIALVEINAETDFVVHNDRFKQFAHDIAHEVAETKPASLEQFLEQKFSKDPTITVDQYRALTMQSLGENIKIRRLQIFPKPSQGSIGIYSHMGGKIVTLVEIEGGVGQEMLAHEIALHVTATSPDYLKPEEVPADVKAREEEIARGQVAGKPQQIIDKIIEGKLRAFYEKVCLLRQKFVKEDTITITDLLAREGKRVGMTLSIRRFVRWKVGE